MIEILQSFEPQFAELEEKLADPNIMEDIGNYRKLMQERSHLEPIIEALNSLRTLGEELEAAKEMLGEEDDEDLLAMAKDEIAALEEDIAAIEQKSKMFLIPPRSDGGEEYYNGNQGRYRWRRGCSLCSRSL